MQIIKLIQLLGWLLFFLMWIPFMLMMFGPEGFAGDGGGISGVPLIGTLTYEMMFFGMMISAIVLLVGGFSLTGIYNARILTKGEEANAQITDLRETGTTVNEMPLIEFKLRVSPGKYAPFNATSRQVVSVAKLALFQPGTEVIVKYLPGREQVVITGVQAANSGDGKMMAGTGFGDGSQILRPRQRSSLAIWASALFVPLILLGVGLFMAYIFLYASKHYEEYPCAVAELKKNQQAIEMLGEPLEMGFTATGNYSASENSRYVYFNTSVTGPKGTADFYTEVSRFRRSGSQMKMTLTKDGEEKVLYQGEYLCK